MKRLLPLLAALLLTGCGVQGPPPDTAPMETVLLETEAATLPAATEMTVPETTAPSETQPEIFRPFDDGGCLNYGTVLLGDSLTFGLVNYLESNGYMGEGRYMAIAGGSLRSSYLPDYTMGAKITASFGGNCYSPEFEGFTMTDALAEMGEDVQAVYMMFGCNDSDGTAGHEYITAVDQILEACPNARVFLQTIPTAYTNRVNYGRINGLLEYVALHYEEEERFVLLDSNSVFTQQHLLPDGLHLSEYGQETWHQWLMESAKEYYP